MNKILLYGLVVLDFLGFFMAISIIECVGKTSPGCQRAVTSPVSWVGAIAALVCTILYLRKHPLSINVLTKPSFPWFFGVYYFFALIFFGENTPEIVGYLRGLPLGAPGTHASLMEPSLFFTGNSGTFVNLLGFAAIAAFFAILFRKLNFLTALVGAVLTGTFAEYITHVGKGPEIPEGFDLVGNFSGTIIGFVTVWTEITLVPVLLFAGVRRVWKDKGVYVLTVVMILLNILSYVFFLYERDVAKNVQSGYLNNQAEVMLPVNTCPDQIQMDNGKVIAYKNGQEMFIKGQVQMDWIQANCSNLKNQKR